MTETPTATEGALPTVAMPFATSNPEILAIRRRCPTHAVCPPCREGFGHWRPADGVCVDCTAVGPHYCRSLGAAGD